MRRSSGSLLGVFLLPPFRPAVLEPHLKHGVVEIGGDKSLEGGFEHDEDISCGG